jgi:membrane associated rhomboid family serine protease
MILITGTENEKHNIEESAENVVEKDAGKPKFIITLFISLSFIILLWLIKLFEEFTHIDLSVYGVYPKETYGLPGIIFAPLIHGDFSHLISNSITLFVLMLFLFYAYTNSSFKVFLISYFATNALVWFFGRPSYHIGASGLVYGILAFLFFVGLFRRDPKSIGLSLLVTFLYGGLVWGIFPSDPKISFESHFSGSIIGIICAVLFRKSDTMPEKYDWEIEEEDENDNNAENSDGDIIKDDTKSGNFKF